MQNACFFCNEGGEKDEVRQYVVMTKLDSGPTSC